MYEIGTKVRFLFDIEECGVSAGDLGMILTIGTTDELFIDAGVMFDYCVGLEINGAMHNVPCYGGEIAVIQ